MTTKYYNAHLQADGYPPQYRNAVTDLLESYCGQDSGWVLEEAMKDDPALKQFIETAMEAVRHAGLTEEEELDCPHIFHFIYHRYTNEKHRQSLLTAVRDDFAACIKSLNGSNLVYARGEVSNYSPEPLKKGIEYIDTLLRGQQTSTGTVLSIVR